MYVVSEGGVMLLVGRLNKTWFVTQASDVVTTGGDYSKFTDWQLYNAWNYDFVWELLLEGLGFSIDFPVQVGDTFVSAELTIERPVQDKYDFRKDFRRYGSHLNLIPYSLSLVRGAFKGHPTRRPPHDEKGVHHTTADGTCIASSGQEYGTEFTFYRWSNSITTREWNMVGAPNLVTSSRVPTHYLTTDWFVILDPDDFLGKVQTYLQQNPSMGDAVMGNARLQNVSHFSFASSWRSLDISYVQRVRWPWGVSYTDATFSTTIKVEGRDFVDSSGAPIVGYITRKDVISGETVGPGNNPKYSYWGTAGTRSFKGTVAAVGHVVDTSYSEPELIDRVRDHIHVLDLKRSGVMDDIRKSAYVSCGDALQGYDRVIQNNYFESLSDLRDVMSLMPDLGPLNKLIRAVGAGSLLTGALTFVDVVSNAYLLYKFGLEPMASDLRSLAEGLDDLANRHSSDKRIEVRGKFSYTFPADDPLSGCKLVTRSKVVFRLPKSSIIAAMLSYRSGGFDVSPSSAWDLVPFSFVVDWFANLGERMEMGYDHLRFLSIELAYCVHSFSVYRPMVNTEDFVFSDGAELKHYERAVSQFLPSPKEGRYDFLSPQSKPPLASAGALLWSVIR